MTHGSATRTSKIRITGIEYDSPADSDPAGQEPKREKKKGKAESEGRGGKGGGSDRPPRLALSAFRYKEDDAWYDDWYDELDALRLKLGTTGDDGPPFLDPFRKKRQRLSLHVPQHHADERLEQRFKAAKAYLECIHRAAHRVQSITATVHSTLQQLYRRAAAITQPRLAVWFRKAAAHHIQRRRNGMMERRRTSRDPAARAPPRNP